MEFIGAGNVRRIVVGVGEGNKALHIFRRLFQLKHIAGYGGRRPVYLNEVFRVPPEGKIFILVYNLLNSE